tara:strand:+ start:2203 stop:2403 length:201 start_codon:yes stop_codon:yes gene_type:complete
MCFGGGGAQQQPRQEQPRTDTTYAYLDKVPVKRETKDPSAPKRKTQSSAPSTAPEATKKTSPLNIA